MPRTIFATFAFGAALFASLPASAQETRDQEITITGQKEVPPEVARRFVTSIATTFEGQLARFVAPVCPVVIGLPDAYSLRIVERIRHDAREAGVQVPDKKCRPNLVVIVARDADVLVKQMHKTLPGMFAGLKEAEMRRALRSGPVHVWNTVITQNEDGEEAGGASTDSGGGDAPMLQVRSASFIELPTRQAVLQSVVVLDAAALVDKSINQIADYVAMRTLAGARPPKQGVEADTILTLFDEGAVPPPTLTSIDRSFLKGIYKMRPLGRGTLQRASISRTITRDSKARTAGE